MAINSNTKYGITPQGFVRMRLPEIQSNLFDRFESKVGQTVSRKPNSVIAIILSLVAEESDQQWQLAEYDYYARSPMTADDGSIDNTVMYSNVLRRGEEYTYFYEVCYGRNGFVLPANCQVKGSDGEKYNIAAPDIITLDNCVSVTLFIPNVTEGDSFGFILNKSVRVSYTAVTGDNVEAVYSKLLQQIPGDEWSGSILDGNLVLNQADRRYGGTVVPTETFNVIEVGSPIKFVAENYGPLDPLLKTVTFINTNYDGWTAASNESAAYVGRNLETATELRQRYAAAVFRTSRAMKESIKAALLDLPDVDSVTVYENRSDEIVDGMKPHSFEVIIHGGDDIQIAQTILEKGPIGIDSNGSIEMTVIDSEGTPEKVYFNRPKEIPIYIQVTVWEYKEENLPGDLVNTIKDIIIESGSNLGMGKDVIAQRFLGPIYSKVNGIGYMDIVVSEDDQVYTEKSIPIDRGEIAVFDAEHITVAMEIKSC